MRNLYPIIIALLLTSVNACSNSKNAVSVTENQNELSTTTANTCGATVYIKCNSFSPGNSITGEIIIRNDSAKNVEVEISPWNSNTVVQKLIINANSAERYGWAVSPQSCPSAGGLIKIKSCKPL